MKNLIFDIGGVILKDKPNIVLNNIELSIDEKEIINDLFFSDFTNLDLGLESLEEHYNKCSLNFNNDIKKYLINYYLYRPFNEKLLNSIINYKDNFNIYILSDNNRETISYLKEKLDFIDGWIVSCDYNSLKRDGKLFDILLSKYNINPKESLFIDDNVVNIIVAQSKELKTFLFDNNIEELIDYINKQI